MGVAVAVCAIASGPVAVTGAGGSDWHEASPQLGDHARRHRLSHGRVPGGLVPRRADGDRAARGRPMPVPTRGDVARGLPLGLVGQAGRDVGEAGGGAGALPREPGPGAREAPRPRAVPREPEARPGVPPRVAGPGGPAGRRCRPRWRPPASPRPRPPTSTSARRTRSGAWPTRRPRASRSDLPADCGPGSVGPGPGRGSPPAASQAPDPAPVELRRRRAAWGTPMSERAAIRGETGGPRPSRARGATRRAAVPASRSCGRLRRRPGRAPWRAPRGASSAARTCP